MKQEEALEVMKGANNVFLTGQPGTGKTWLINKYVDWCVDNGTLPTLTASTGIAAVHIGGTTLHSWAGIRNEEALTGQDLQDILSNPYTMRRIRDTEVLIIDEISMVSKTLLNLISRIAIEARGSIMPFGGIKVIAVGDFFQLPPVKGDFAFESEAWQQADFKVCYLDEQKRQSDSAFIGILTGIRAGILDASQKALLRGRFITDVSSVDAIRLDTHNVKVDSINQMKLERLEGTPKTYVMETEGNEKAIESLKKNCLSPERLILKIGAKIIFTRNDRDLRWVNGTQGKVIAIEDEVLRVETMDGQMVHVDPVTWERAEGYGKNKKVIASITQVPLRLAWAITIHKSQGMTLDRAVIDVSHAFAEGHAYVAISRIKSLDGLYLQGSIAGNNFLKTSDKVNTMDKVFLSK